MNEMLERVAKALADCALEPFDELSRSKYMGDARAAIEAMREPTDEMCEAAEWHQQSDVNQYQRAIDAALGKVDA